MGESKQYQLKSILLNEPKACSWLMNCFIQLTCRENQYLDYYVDNGIDFIFEL